MTTLWLRFAEDTTLPDTLDPDAQIRLARIFDDVSPDSEWNKALSLLALKPQPHPEGMLKWLRGTPYINWSYLVTLIGAGAVQVIPTASGGYGYKVRYTPQSLLGLMAGQWKISRFLARQAAKSLPQSQTDRDRIVLSLALGQALLALTLRLPAHTPEQLAQWLRQPDQLPRGLKKTIQDILQIQSDRTALSSAWASVFPASAGARTVSDLPPYFWNEIGEVSSADKGTHPGKDRWKGLPVAGGIVTGRAVLVGRDGLLPETENSDPLVLIFPRARPETVELFAAASAILYGEGGLMSHACTIAREEGKTCVTALGRDFTATLETLGDVWLSVDGGSGEIRILK